MASIIPDADLVPSVTSRIVTIDVADMTEGAPANGEITFTLPCDLHVPKDRKVIQAGSETVVLSAGKGSIRLPTHDSDITQPRDWVIWVKKSWLPRPYPIRVPAGSSSSISLAEIPPAELVPHGARFWAITGGSLTITEGANWNGSATVSNGIIHIHLTVPPGGAAFWKGGTPLDEMTNWRTLDAGMYSINRGDVAESFGLPPLSGTLIIGDWNNDKYGTAMFISRGTGDTTRLFINSKSAGSWDDWVEPTAPSFADTHVTAKGEDDPDWALVEEDEAGMMSRGVDHFGRTWLRLHEDTEGAWLPSLSRYAEHLPENSPWLFAISDKAGQVAAGVRRDGSWWPGGASGREGWDVILLVGQSNMQGRGRPGRAKEPWESVQQFPAANWPNQQEVIDAVDPLLHPGNMSMTSPDGLGVPLGKAWAIAHPHRKVLLVPAAFGATGFSTPAPDTWDRSQPGNLADRAIAQTRKAMSAVDGDARLVAICWHQGEGDNSISAEYADRLDDLAAYFRSQLNAPDVPFVVGQMSPDRGGGSNAVVIDAAHQTTPARVERSAFVPTPPGLHNTGDRTHLSTRAFDILGVRFAEGIERARLNIWNTHEPIAPENVRAHLASDRIRVDWDPAWCWVDSYNVVWRADETSDWSSADVQAETPLTTWATVPAAATEVRVATVNPNGMSSPVIVQTGGAVLASLGTGGEGGSILWSQIADPPATYTPAEHIHPLASSTRDGFMSVRDKVLLSTIDQSPNPDTLAVRNANGTLSVAAPTADEHAATMRYVTEAIAGASTATAWDAITGAPTAFPPEAHTHTTAEVTGLDDALAGLAVADHTHPVATGTTDGLMPATDKARLDAATGGNIGSTLVTRHSDGTANFSDPVGVRNAATKGYVDKADALKADAPTSANGALATGWTGQATATRIGDTATVAINATITGGTTASGTIATGLPAATTRTGGTDPYLDTLAITETGRTLRIGVSDSGALLYAAVDDQPVAEETLVATCTYIAA